MQQPHLYQYVSDNPTPFHEWFAIVESLFDAIGDELDELIECGNYQFYAAYRRGLTPEQSVKEALESRAN